jgi:hypothetical protein
MYFTVIDGVSPISGDPPEVAELSSSYWRLPEDKFLMWLAYLSGSKAMFYSQAKFDDF